MVYLHSANVFQSLMVRSLLPDTICLLSTEKATLNTSYNRETIIIISKETITNNSKIKYKSTCINNNQ